MPEEHSIGPLRYIPGGNGGKYPYCNSVYIEGAGVLIDPGADPERLKALRDGPGVREIWLSHWHEDHIAYLNLFEGVPFRQMEIEAEPLASLEAFLDCRPELEVSLEARAMLEKLAAQSLQDDDPQ